MVYNAITSSKLDAATIHGCLLISFIVILNRELGLASRESGFASQNTLFPVILVHRSVHALQAEGWDDLAH